MNSTSEALELLKTFYDFYKNQPQDAEEQCPLYWSNLHHRLDCVDVCYKFSELTDGQVIYQYKELSCPCHAYGIEEAFNRLKELLEREGVI